MFGLLGTNGAGKSTTFKMLTGEIGFTSGNIWIGNKLNLQQHLRKLKNLIGYCPQGDFLDQAEVKWIVIRGLLRGHNQLPCG
jgi:ATP-binding cassette subfamily A (ABC1) protein 3